MKTLIQREIKKKNLVINCQKKIIDDYRILCFETYKNLGVLDLFNYSNFFKVAFSKFKECFYKKLNKIEQPTPGELRFYSKTKQVNPFTNTYNKKEELNTLTIRLSEAEIEDFFIVMHNFYIHHYKSKFKTFSPSIFFQIILNDFKSFQYDITELL